MKAKDQVQPSEAVGDEPASSETPESETPVGGQPDPDTDETESFVCAAHDRPMEPNPRGSRYRWDCGAGSPGSCTPISAESA